MSNAFLDNRLKYHTASRVGAKETDPLLNALNRDQHTVHYRDIWTSPIVDFPLNTGTNKDITDSSIATDDLVSVFKTGGTFVSFRNGFIWTNTKYPAVKLYENVEMHPVQYSNGSGIFYEAYEVLDDHNIRLQDWVSPLAVFDPIKNKPVPGYAGKLEVNLKGTTTWVEVQKTDKSTDSSVQGSVWAAKYGNWEFVYSAGLATFNADYTPTRYEDYFAIYGGTSDIKDVVKLRWTGFLYTGSYLGGKLLSGISLDKYVSYGLVKIDLSDVDSNTSTKPPISDCTGYLQVFDIDRNQSSIQIRQTFYPDSEDESTPYFRIGSGSSAEEISWSEWIQMGGGSLRRVVVDGTTTPETITAKNNVMYESFCKKNVSENDDYYNTFELPDPNSVPVGTRIGIEQYEGSSKVICGSSYVQWIESDVKTTETSVPTDAISYIFECVISQDEISREWILDVDHNYGFVTTKLASDILDAKTAVDDLRIHVDNLDDAYDTRLARQTKYLAISNSTVLESVAPSPSDKASDEAWKTFLTNNPNNLYYYDLVVSVSFVGSTITLPVTNVQNGTKVTVELIGGTLSTGNTCTVKTANNAVSQTFTATQNTILVLEFEYTRTAAAAYAWTLLSLY